MIQFIERLVLFTSNGIFITMFQDDGVIIDVSNTHYLQGKSITDCQHVKADMVLVVIEKQYGLSEIITLDIENG